MTISIEQRSKFCIPLETIRLEDLPKVGGKTASLGEMIQELKPLGVDVPGMSEKPSFTLCFPP
jgi:pyruvate,water dikinase